MNALDLARQFFKLEKKIKKLKAEEYSNQQAIAKMDDTIQKEKIQVKIYSNDVIEVLFKLKKEIDTNNEDINKELPELIEKRDSIKRILENIEILVK